MESLIPFIIMLLLGSLFSSGKKKSSNEDKKQPKPFTAQPKKQENPMGKLKEMSKDLYKELQQELEQHSGAGRQSQPNAAPARAPERKAAQVEVKKTEERVRRQVSLERGPKEDKQSEQIQRHANAKPKNTTRDLIPRDSDDLMKGVIFSEIFGPPKSRR